MHFSGQRTLVKHNWVTRFDICKTDGGGIYSNQVISNTLSRITHNIVGDMTTPFLGNSGYGGNCIYMDCPNAGIQIDSNTMYKGYTEGMSLCRDSFTVYNNTIDDSASRCLHIPAGISHQMFNVKRNIWYQRKSTSYVVYQASVSNSIIDSNKILKPSNQTGQMGVFATPSTYSIAGWRVLTGFELNSDSTLSSYASSNVATLYINPSLNDSTIALPYPCVDAYGNLYRYSITIHPYESALLWPSSYTYPNSPGRLYKNAFKVRST